VREQGKCILQDFGRKIGNLKPELVEGWRFSEEKAALRQAQCSNLDLIFYKK
jgi:hypothetical protein